MIALNDDHRESTRSRNPRFCDREPGDRNAPRG
jgi:hypothetical protein